MSRNSMFPMLLTCFAASLMVPANANNYVQDAKSCNLNEKATLKSMCPAGMGMPTYPSPQEMINRNPNIANMIIDSARKYGVDPKLALAVSASEGAMSACAGSHTGVQGPMQLTQATGRSFGMDRGILSENINGGVLTLKDAIRRCGGDSNIRCLADKYNGSTEAERRNWTSGVTRRLAALQTTPIPNGCDVSSQACYQSDAPPTNRSVAGGAPSGLGSIAPPPQPTDIVVGSGMAMLDDAPQPDAG